MGKKAILTVAAVALVLSGVGAAIKWRAEHGAKTAIAGASASATAPDESRLYGLGTVEAKTLSRLGFELAGTLHGLTVDQGDRVQRGQELAMLDVRDQLARVAQAEAGVRQAQAGLSQAAARLERAKAVRDQRRSFNQRRQTLASNGTISQEAAEDALAGSQVAVADVAVAQADVEAAQGAIQSAQARLDLERALLDKSRLTAPFDGIIIERSRELGSAVTAGLPVLVLADPASIWVTAYVDESLSGRLRAGQRAEIHLRSAPAGQTLKGRVQRIDLENDRVSEERRVQVAFDQPPFPFTLGEQADVLIDVSASAP